MQQILNPPALFFLLGLLGTILRTGLSFPQPIPKLLSLYLLFAIGFQGGHKLAVDPPYYELLCLLALGIIFSFIFPAIAFVFMKRFVKPQTAAAIGAAYGSVSAVTFMTGVSFLQELKQPFSGSMVALLALMESPAILTGLFLASKSSETAAETSFLTHVRHSFLNSSVFCLLGSFMIGWIAKEQDWQTLVPFYHDPFKGVLTLFLVDMGVVAGGRLRNLIKSGPTPFLFALIVPLLLGCLAVFIASYLTIGTGDALLFALLIASASYIAVPAVMTSSVPSADPGLYVPMALGLTFPVNITIGIPLYWGLIQNLWGTS